MVSKYSVGIDLGTTNSVVAYAPLDSEQAAVSVLSIEQVVAPNQIEARTGLPSFLYLPDESEVASAGATRAALVALYWGFASVAN